ncbi:hypothetical protein FALCPG4_013263 [Fusarium falciforme]
MDGFEATTPPPNLGSLPCVDWTGLDPVAMDCTAQPSTSGTFPKNPLQCISSISISDRGSIRGSVGLVRSFPIHALWAPKMPLQMTPLASHSQSRVRPQKVKRGFCLL